MPEPRKCGQCARAFESLEGYAEHCRQTGHSLSCGGCHGQYPAPDALEGHECTPAQTPEPQQCGSGRADGAATAVSSVSTAATVPTVPTAATVPTVPTAATRSLSLEGLDPPRDGAHWICTAAALDRAAALLRAAAAVACDLEAVCTGGERLGPLSLLQFALPGGAVLLVDVLRLGPDAVREGLRPVLEAAAPLKLMYDCRSDAQASPLPLSHP